MKKLIYSESFLIGLIYASYFLLVGVVIFMATFATFDMNNWLLKEDKEAIILLIKTFYPPIAILTSATIAGVGIIQNIHNNNRLEQERLSLEKEKNQKVIQALLRSLRKMLDDQKELFDVHVPLNTNYWYSDFILKEKIIIPLQVLINDQTQKHLSAEITEKSFEIYDLSLCSIADMTHMRDNPNTDQGFMLNQIKEKMEKLEILLNELENLFSFDNQKEAINKGKDQT